MACEKLRALRETFLDGELPSLEMLELQVHVDACAECAEAVAFSLAVRKSTREVVQEGGLVSESFRARLSQALQAAAREERREGRKLAARRPRFGAPEARRLAACALASAAAVALWMQPQSQRTQQTGEAATASLTNTTVKADEYLERLLDYHTAPPAPQVTEFKLLPALERDVGVRMRLPRLDKYGAEWQWASVVRVRGDQPPTAYLRFRTADAHNVTVYVYNPSRVRLHEVLKQRMLGEEPVYEDYRRGFSIAAQLRNGVGYAVATDLDEPLSAELVRAVSSSAVAN